MASPQLRHVAQRARLDRAEKRFENRHNFHGPCKTSGKQRQKNIRISPGRNRQKKSTSCVSDALPLSMQTMDIRNTKTCEFHFHSVCQTVQIWEWFTQSIFIFFCKHTENRFNMVCTKIQNFMKCGYKVIYKNATHAFLYVLSVCLSVSFTYLPTDLPTVQIWKPF